MPLQIERRLPGLALRDNNGKIPFYAGRVYYASERVQWVQTNHPEHKLVYLIGDTFAYWCRRCKHTVWQQEVTMRGRLTCPACELRVLALSPGDRVRLHFRYGQQTEWATWWAEGVEVQGG